MLKQKINKKYIVIIAVILVALSVGGAVLAFSNRDNGTPIQETQLIDEVATTTSPEPTAQADFSEATGDREPGNSLSENDGSSTVESSDVIVDTTNPILSDDKNTSLYSPSENETVKSGTIISGKTHNSNVFYRLIDDKSGVTGEGELKIKNGKFSGKLAVDSRGSKGRLDIFSRNNDGSEYSIIYVEVKF